MQEKNPSLKLNMILNAINGFMSVILPLITFPYVSRILGVENIGRYNFAASVVSYFILFAEFGINTYAVREGAAKKKNKKELNNFANRIISFNVLTSIFSFILLLILIFTVPKFKDYTVLLLILSLQVLLKPFAVEWIYSVYEDYLYITLRSIAFQVIFIALLVLIFRNHPNLIMYVSIVAFSACCTNIFNFIYSRKYLVIGFTKDIKIRDDIKSILMIFGMSLTSTIYVSSDTTILGFLCDDHVVGIYSASVQVYTIVKMILSSVLVVSIPRLAAYYGNNELNEFKTTAVDIYKTLLTVVMPSITALIIFRKHIVRAIGGKQYLESSSSLGLLGIALLFCMSAWFWGQCVLVATKHEKDVFAVTVVCAIVNIVLNFALIPLWQENAAAFTTIIAEATAYVWCMYKGKKYIKLEGFISVFLKSVIGCIGMLITGLLLMKAIEDILIQVIVIVPVSIILYTLIEMILKNEVACSLLKEIKSKVINEKFQKYKEFEMRRDKDRE